MQHLLIWYVNVSIRETDVDPENSYRLTLTTTNWKKKKNNSQHKPTQDKVQTLSTKDGEVKLKPVQLVWGFNVVPIIDFFKDEDKIVLFFVSKKSKMMMNRYCLW